MSFIDSIDQDAFREPTRRIGKFFPTKNYDTNLYENLFEGFIKPIKEQEWLAKDKEDLAFVNNHHLKWHFGGIQQDYDKFFDDIALKFVCPNERLTSIYVFNHSLGGIGKSKMFSILLTNIFKKHLNNGNRDSLFDEKQNYDQLKGKLIVVLEECDVLNAAQTSQLKSWCGNDVAKLRESGGGTGKAQFHEIDLYAIFVLLTNEDVSERLRDSSNRRVYILSPVPSNPPDPVLTTQAEEEGWKYVDIISSPRFQAVYAGWLYARLAADLLPNGDLKPERLRDIKKLKMNEIRKEILFGEAEHIKGMFERFLDTVADGEERSATTLLNLYKAHSKQKITAHALGKMLKTSNSHKVSMRKTKAHNVYKITKKGGTK